MDSERQWPELQTNPDWRAAMAKARGSMSQTELARKVGEVMGQTPAPSQAMISKIESGASTSSELIMPICRVLGIDLPQHYVDDQQREWAEIGMALRRRDPKAYELEVARYRHQMEKEKEAEQTDPDPTKTT